MKNKKIYIIFCILIIIFSASLTEKTFQNDTFALIAMGRDGFINKIDGYDHLTFHEGLKSADSSLIFEKMLFKTYELFNFSGIYILIMILSAINGLLLFNVLIKSNKSKVISFIITIFALYFSSFLFTARPTIMVIPIFMIIVICIERILETNKNIYCFFIIISSVLLINTHDVMWFIHFILYIPFIAEHILASFRFNKYINKKIIIEKYKNIKKIMIVIILDVVCLFSRHSIGNAWALIKEILYTVTGDLEISELSSVNIIDSISLIIIIVFFISQFFLKHKTRISYLFMTLGLIIFSILGYRYSVFLYFIGSIYINKILYNILVEYDRKEFIEKIDIISSKFLNISIVSLIIIVISINNFYSNVTNDYISEEFPVDVCEYIKQNLDIEKIRVYNHFNFGAYLEFCNIPNFIDGRSGIYYQKYGETSIVEDFLEIPKGDYEKIFQKYKISHVIVMNEEILNEKLYKDTNYKLLYQSDMFALYEKINK